MIKLKKVGDTYTLSGLQQKHMDIIYAACQMCKFYPAITSVTPHKKDLIPGAKLYDVMKVYEEWSGIGVAERKSKP